MSVPAGDEEPIIALGEPAESQVPTEERGASTASGTR